MRGAGFCSVARMCSKRRTKGWRPAPDMKKQSGRRRVLTGRSLRSLSGNYNNTRDYLRGRAAAAPRAKPSEHPESER
jgi:hypothetical protein